MKYLKLMRAGNLAIIVLTLYAMRFGVIYPMLKISDFSLLLPEWLFVLLVLSVVLIAAAGYILNDYFDLETDAVNAPNKPLVANEITANFAFNLHLAFNIIGLGLAFYVCNKIGFTNFAFIHVICASLLWFYSSSFKDNSFLAFLIIAFLCGMVPLIALFEIPLLNIKHHELMDNLNFNFNFILKFVAAFAAFSFLITISREMVKDMEDREGDQQSGRKTIAISFGNKWAKMVALVPVITSIFLLGKLQLLQIQSNDKLSFIYLLIFLQFPLAFFLFKLYTANTIIHFKFLTRLLKIIMLLGLSYTVVIRYSFLGFH